MIDSKEAISILQQISDGKTPTEQTCGLSQEAFFLQVKELIENGCLQEADWMPDENSRIGIAAVYLRDARVSGLGQLLLNSSL